jgi:hypothetical protein
MRVGTYTYEVRLAKRVANGEPNAADAALELLVYANPGTLAEAVALVWPDRRVPPDRFDALAQAWDVYWHLRDTPCD